MSHHEMVSIIIPVYNRVGFIEETLKSVVSQTYPNWEAIVVDDGSTDGTPVLVSSIASDEPRIKLFQRDRPPKGAPVCRNIGVAKSSGNFLIFLDSDDILAPFCIQRRMELFFESEKSDFLVFRTLLFNHKINDLKIQWNTDTDEDDLKRFLRLDALWQTTGPIYRREAILRINGFDESLPFWQDFDLHIKCLVNGMSYKKCYHLPPDNYHRINLVDGLSRTIPLVEDRAILQKRIDFYHSVRKLIEHRGLLLSPEQNHAIISVLFYFTSSYLDKHNCLSRFSFEWRRVRDIHSVNWLQYQLNFVYAILGALSRRHSLYLMLHKTYKRVFNKHLMDKDIIEKSMIGKIKVKD